MGVSKEMFDLSDRLSKYFIDRLLLKKGYFTLVDVAFERARQRNILIYIHDKKGNLIPLLEFYNPTLNHYITQTKRKISDIDFSNKVIDNEGNEYENLFTFVYCYKNKK